MSINDPKVVIWLSPSGETSSNYTNKNTLTAALLAISSTALAASSAAAALPACENSLYKQKIINSDLYSFKDVLIDKS